MFEPARHAGPFAGQRRGRRFVADFETGNEHSNAEEKTFDQVVVESATCDPDPAITMTVDATLGSEPSDMPTTDVAGTLVLTDD